MTLTAPAAPSRLDGRWVNAPRRISGIAIGWPLWCVVGGYPIAWILGLRLVVWPLVAVLLVFWMLRNSSTNLVVPRCVVVWVAFVGWTLISVLTVHSANRLMAWGYRESLYLTALVVLVFCVNVTPREVPTWRFARAFAQLFTWTVLLGTLGLLMPDLNLTTPTELVLPQSLSHIDFIATQVQANMGVTATAIDAVRPAAPYGYTNEWGAALGMLWPLAMYSTSYVRTRRARLWLRLMLAFSIVPVIISVNRGLWVSLIVALAVVVIRAGISRHVRTTITAFVVAAGAAAVILLTPLSDVISNRLGHENLSTRETLASGAVELTRQSPLFGYGAPQTVSVANSNDVAVGTHGQIYTLLVSHGIPGAVFYIAFFLAALYVTRKVSGPAVWAWAAIVVCLVQLPFYNSIPVPLVLAMMATACCLRELGWRGRPPPPQPSPIIDRQTLVR